MKKSTGLSSIRRRAKRLVKGKIFRKSEFGTSWWDMTLRGKLLMRSSRPVGNHSKPSCLELPALGATAGAPVRIYIGTEPAQHRAERILLWSILKQRDQRRHYQIYLMKELIGFDRRNWKTGFTAYRYAIPEFAGFAGRAIYNDVDQIYLADPAMLFDLDMGEAGVLAVDGGDTSVMLMDCERLRDTWTIEGIYAAPESSIHTAMLQNAPTGVLLGQLPRCWNSRDHEYDAKSSCLLHYTILHTQPWRPFREDLRYQDNAWGDLWHTLEEEADAAGFAEQWKLRADCSYGEMAEFYTVINV